MHRIDRSHAASASLLVSLLIAACAGAPPAAPTNAGPTGAATGAPTEAPASFEPGSVSLMTHSAPPGTPNNVARAFAEAAAEIGIADSPWPVEVREGGSGALAMNYLLEQEGNPNILANISFTWVSAPILTGEGAQITDFTPIASLYEEPTGVYVSGTSDIMDLDDLKAAAEAAAEAGDSFVMAQGSLGSGSVVQGFILAEALGVEMEVLSLESTGERVAAVISGNGDVNFDDLVGHAELVNNGDLRLIAILSDQRSELWPDVPTAAEQGYDAEFLPSTNGLVAAPGISAEAVAYWEDVARQVTESDSWQTFVEEAAAVTAYRDSEEWGTFLDGAAERLTELYTDLGIAGEG